MLESNEKSTTYLKEIRDWLDAHPGEIIVLWMSKHGNGGAIGEEAYPGVSAEDKQAFWGQVEEVFEGIMLDTSVSQVNVTTVNELIER